jgi:hypothetical protein
MQMMQMKKMMMKINGKVMENWMEKFEKYLKYVPLIYALYLPINFLLHMYEAFNGCIMPVFMYALDFVRVLVIIAFSYYLANAYTTKGKWHPSGDIMIFAGVSFLEWIVNIVMSGVYVESYRDHTGFLIFFGMTTLVGYFFELKAFYKIASTFDGAPDAGWVIYNVIVLFIVVIVIAGRENASKVFTVVIICRALIRAVFIRKIVKKQYKTEAVPTENPGEGE